uniref:Putative methanol O-anthraniloyltransferase n=1 Tax=Davidia involucrata TaxID=16924 RepID=A0A5B7ARG0_DAVIN
MALRSSVPFSVRRREPEQVMPAKPTPCEVKQLSDIDDQEGLRFHFPMIMFYKANPLMKGKDPVRVIRETVAKALVYYYPYAGRLVEGPNRKLMVDCNGEGVLFIEGDANVRLGQLDDTIQPPCPYRQELLSDVPGSGGILGCPLMLIQVTRLLCGGFVLAVRLNHTMSDALGLVQFLNAVGEMAQGASAPSLLPVWQRELLNARCPPRITYIHHEYEEESDKNSSPVTMDHDNNLVHQSFFFGPKEINAMKKHLPPQIQSCSSTFDVTTACVWRASISALNIDPDEIVRVTLMVNVRDKRGLNLPNGYYGNAIASPAAASKAGTLCSNPLGYALELLKNAKAQVSEEYVRSVADLMVIKGRPPYSRMWNYLVSDTSRAGFGEVDFGWGKPVYGGTVGAVFSNNSIYARVRNSEGEEGIVVPMCLPFAVMERFHEELAKMTQEPVENLYHIQPIKITSML